MLSKIRCSQLPLFARKHEELSGKDKVNNATNFWSYRYSKEEENKKERRNRVLVLDSLHIPGYKGIRSRVVQKVLVAGTTMGLRCYCYCCFVLLPLIFDLLITPLLERKQEVILSYDLWITKIYSRAWSCDCCCLVALCFLWYFFTSSSTCGLPSDFCWGFLL